MSENITSPDINPQDIIDNFDNIKEQIEKILGDQEKLNSLVTNFCKTLESNMPENDEQRENIRKFLILIPVEARYVFIEFVNSLSRNTDEFKYFNNLHLSFLPNEEYKKVFYDEVIEYYNKTLKDKKNV